MQTTTDRLRVWRLAALLTMSLCAAGALTGCETSDGLGDDIEEVGDDIEDALD